MALWLTAMRRAQDFLLLSPYTHVYLRPDKYIYRDRHTYFYKHGFIPFCIPVNMHGDPLQRFWFNLNWLYMYI